MIGENPGIKNNPRKNSSRKNSSRKNNPGGGLFFDFILRRRQIFCWW